MKSSLKRIRIFAAKVLSTTRAALQEVFDEAAYSRFLNRAGIASSSEAYAAFRREVEEAKMRRPKCC
jgi:hypothetical protein